MDGCESLPGDWEEELRGWLDPAYWSELCRFLDEAYASDDVVPPRELIFAALDATAWRDTDVVIVGQDPYPGVGHANGLAFSVSPDVHPPASLTNIHQELHDDLGFPEPDGGSLEPWACQGVLLLNATLTFSGARQATHRRMWKPFTDAVVQSLERREPIFLLWGREAQRKVLRFVDRTSPTVICSSHPAPRAAWRCFFGSKPFSRANEVLRTTGRPEIDWDLSKPC
jgi:uracil-DNA glycosylase